MIRRMADVWVVLTIVAFFALCVGLVWGCDRMIGPDETSDLAGPADEADDEATPEVTTAAVR
jgi:hypothetical protein